MKLGGFVTISIEGFFIERFMNLCLNNDIILWDVKKEDNTFIRLKIKAEDFKRIKKYAKKTKCRIKIEHKTGIPFILFNYRKRKMFIIMFFAILIAMFISSRFVWKVDINGLETIDKIAFENMLKEENIKVRKFKK